MTTPSGTPATCPDCGFCWATTSLDDVVPGIDDAVDAMVDVLLRLGGLVAVRPAVDRWSVLEYAGHVRDVLLSIRERLILASIVDDYESQPIHRDARVDLGFYGLDTPEDVADELDASARLCTKAVACLPEAASNRTMYYSFLSPAPVPLTWVAAQALHECQHHLGDMRSVAAAVEG